MKKILVVDDNENNLKNAVDSMEELGYEVVSASSAKEAVQLIKKISKQEDIFLILSDMDMEAEESGMEVVSASSDFCIPCILVTGGLDHGRQSIKFMGPLFYPTFPDKGNERVTPIGGIISEEKTKEVWKKAVESFLLFWNRIGENLGIEDYVEWVFETRKEYRKQKGFVITREKQFTFQAGIVPKMTEEYYKRIKWEEERKRREEERKKIVAGRKQKDFFWVIKKEIIQEKCSLCGGNVYEYTYNA